MLVCPKGAKRLASKQRLPYACLFKEASIDKRKQGKQAKALKASFYLLPLANRLFYLSICVQLASYLCLLIYVTLSISPSLAISLFLSHLA
jgi:hypothetical protein